jgi:hypothetical protein
MDIKKIISTCLSKHDKDFGEQIFLQIAESQCFATKLDEYIEDKKYRGNLFEVLCLLYLQNIKKYEEVWLLKDVPLEILSSLGLKRQDIGIDIIVKHKDEFIAVQCKFKSNKLKKYIKVNWKELSTFYTLCQRTGPFSKYLVMTSCYGIKHVGKKDPKERTIARTTFLNMTRDEWGTLLGYKDRTCGTITKEKTLEELRAERIKFFEKK